MVEKLELGEISIEVVKKRIKNLHLRVYPPAGRVRISAPMWVELEAIRTFAISKLAWIRQQQERLRKQERETSREYLDGESRDVWGKRYLLKVLESEGPPVVRLSHGVMFLRVHPGESEERKQAVVEKWYRGQVREVASSIIAKWEPRMGVKVTRLFVRRMKTRWGSCNPSAGSIRLNADLAGRPPECLEYVVVHEMVHLLEPSHNTRFVTLMDQFLPGWRVSRAELNRLPVRREDRGH